MTRTSTPASAPASTAVATASAGTAPVPVGAPSDPSRMVNRSPKASVPKARTMPAINFVPGADRPLITRDTVAGSTPMKRAS